MNRVAKWACEKMLIIQMILHVHVLVFKIYAYWTVLKKAYYHSPGGSTTQCFCSCWLLHGCIVI